MSTPQDQPIPLGLDRVGAIFNRSATPAANQTASQDETWNIGEGTIPIMRDQQGNIVGKMVGGVYHIPLIQLRIAVDAPMRAYNPAHDRHFNVLSTRAKDTSTIETLTVVESEHDTTQIEGVQVPMFDVYLNVRWWHVAVRCQIALVPCVVKKRRDIPNMLLTALAEDTAHKPYSLYDRCMIAMTLNDLPYNISHNLIAQAWNCDRSRISRFIKAVRDQHPVIAGMMASDFLVMDQMEALMEAFPDDKEQRLLLARYAIQTDMIADDMRKLGAQMTLPEGMPRAMLIPVNPNDEASLVQRRYLLADGVLSETNTATPSSPPAGQIRKEQASFYMHRRAPLAANQAEIMRESRTLKFSLVPRPNGPPLISDPNGTAMGRLYQKLRTGEITEIDTVMYETALLADGQRLSDETTRGNIATQADTPLLRRVEIVDAERRRSS